ncbi:MAG: hypothetical protein ABJA02_07730, partial [Acidobacteriota bacterium]
MHKGSTSNVLSFSLVLSFWLGSFAVMPTTAFAQDAKPTPATTEAVKPVSTKAPKPSPTPTAKSTAPLSVKEDPSQIGKRNINGGTDKFFGWLG